MSARHVLFGAVPAIVLAGLATVANTPAPAVENAAITWRAVVVHADGNSDIVEHGVTLDDCEAVLIGFPAAAERICEPEQVQPPRLIGFGCVGAAGPLYAVEESDFPQCERIESL